MLLKDLKLDTILSVGEAKGEDKINDTHATLCDLVKIACFCKNVVDKEYLNSVLGIHVVGM